LCDNARIHTSPAVLENITKHCSIVFNAPYHCEFNAIESFFSVIKNNSRPAIERAE